jgi:hypothetical protein
VTRFEEIDLWYSQVSPIFQRMLASLSVAEQSAANGPSALLSVSDQLGSSERDARVWMAENQCPIPEIDERLRRTLRSTRVLARLFELESANPSGPNLRVIFHEIDGLVGLISTTFAVLSAQRRS